MYARTWATLGFYSAAIDGNFGADTVRAVKDAQRVHGLNADGIAGPLTWQVLVAG